MPPVSADRLRPEIEFLLSRNDPDQLSQREFRNKLEQVLCLEDGALENDKELVNRLVQDFWAQKDAKERPADLIELEVQAEEADGWHFVRRWSLKAERRQQPLRPMLSKCFSEVHPGISASAVDFDVLVNENWVPLEQSCAEDLGWTGAQPLRFLAYPVDEVFVASEATAFSHPDVRDFPTPEVQLVESVTKPKPVRKTTLKSNRVGGNPMPGEGATIEFQQENPKKINSKPWLRYEKYKAARTLQEARDLGAAPGDLRHDCDKGFLSELL